MGTIPLFGSRLATSRVVFLAFAFCLARGCRAPLGESDLIVFVVQYTGCLMVVNRGGNKCCDGEQLGVIARPVTTGLL